MNKNKSPLTPVSLVGLGVFAFVVGVFLYAVVSN